MISEIVLGRGDYAVGGSRSRPFYGPDGALRRRPLIFGEISEGCNPLLASMFSGRASDPIEWAVMWKELGADGICLRDVDPTSVKTISDKTGLPLAVSGKSAEADVGDVMILLDSSARSEHVCARSAEKTEDVCGADMILIRGEFPESYPFDLMTEIRIKGLNGDAGFSVPIIFDATPVWNSGFRDAREASISEGMSALTAMLCGADAVIVKGPGAADMAGVYGEELADL